MLPITVSMSRLRAVGAPFALVCVNSDIRLPAVRAAYIALTCRWISTGIERTLALMQQQMIALVLTDDQIGATIIPLIAVNMVDFMALVEGLPYCPFHDENMFGHIAIAVCPWMALRKNENIATLIFHFALP